MGKEAHSGSKAVPDSAPPLSRLPASRGSVARASRVWIAEVLSGLDPILFLA